MRLAKKHQYFLLLTFFSFLAGCSTESIHVTATPVEYGTEPVDLPTGTFTPIATLEPTVMEIIDVEERETETAIVEQFLNIWISSEVPSTLTGMIYVPATFRIVESMGDADIIIEVADEEGLIDENQSNWVYAVVAPFPTITDGISFEDVKKVWQGDEIEYFESKPILVSPETYQVLKMVLGPPSEDGVEVVDEGDILNRAWEDMPSWAIIPFEQLSPRWKVLRVDEVSPLDKEFVFSNYPLTIRFGLKIDLKAYQDFVITDTIGKILPKTNRDPEKLTVLIMTGTTALVRYTALRMEEVDILYPARDIDDWLLDADITHISNESPFYTKCPPAEPVRVEQRFCSDPSYFDLLAYVGTDIIELTGNHILDWGEEALIYTIDIYKRNELTYFGGGKDLEDARKTQLMEHNGNKLAFMGCSPAGPEVVWATEDQAGSNPCDFEWIESEIKRVVELGYIPIMTFQHWEVEDYKPQSSQRVDFLHAAEIGAVIVSGSQSHFPQSMTFKSDHFIHYGLGNLFFDQIFGDNSLEFIDRHIIYDGRYISTELLTAKLEDYARPRPLTIDERQDLLTDIFDNCNWTQE
ncbi:MAG: CapA family protein [Anaerolineaceae bacterium]|nr:CapA family protein [Anaerolineaceae bacterium]